MNIDETLADLKTVPRSLEDAARGEAGVTFVSLKRTETVVAYAELLARARVTAGALQGLGLARGDRVAMILPDESEFADGFLGIALAGGAAVPIAPPADLRGLDGFLETSRRLITASRAKLVVTTRGIRALLGSLGRWAPDLRRIVSVQELRRGGPFRDPGVRLDDVALVQFTSGSTSAPKGVMLTHANLGANCAVINHDGLRTGPRDRTLAWVPLFHDMGLIGFLLAPMYNGLPTTLLPPLLFLRRPVSWLDYLSKHRATITYAPNFAYAYAAQRVLDGQLAGIDLSCVRVMGCGAEPIHAATLRRFAERFRRCGFEPGAFHPSYGMAESSLGISFARGLTVDRVRVGPLVELGQALPATDEDAGASEFVGCGRPFAGHTLDIVDPRSGESLPERRIGEIRVAGPSVMAGYVDDPESTRAAFDERGRLRTGDLGYRVGEQLYPCGRIKDLVLVRGNNYHPQDLEWAAGRVEGVRAGCVAAFSIPGSDGAERACVVAEARPGTDPAELAAEIRAAVSSALGLFVDEVVAVAPHTIPKTSSGKLRRSLSRERLLGGKLHPPRRGGALSVAGRLLDSQWARLRNGLFGSRVDPTAGDGTP